MESTAIGTICNINNKKQTHTQGSQFLLLCTLELQIIIPSSDIKIKNV